MAVAGAAAAPFVRSFARSLFGAAAASARARAAAAALGLRERSVAGEQTLVCPSTYKSRQGAQLAASLLSHANWQTLLRCMYLSPTASQ